MKKSLFASVLLLNVTIFANDMCSMSKQFYDNEKIVSNSFLFGLECNNTIDMKDKEYINTSSLINIEKTPLVVAVMKDDLEQVQTLIAAGAKVTIQSIITAVRNKNLAMLKVFHQANAPLFFSQYNNIGILRYAYIEPDEKILNFLYSLGLDLQPNYFPPEVLPNVSLWTYDRHLLELKTISFYELSSNTKYEAYRIYHSKKGLITMIDDGKECFMFEQRDNGYAFAKTLDQVKCYQIKKEVDQPVFWETVEYANGGFDGHCWLIEGVKHGKYHVMTSWSGNESKMGYQSLYNKFKAVHDAR